MTLLAAPDDWDLETADSTNPIPCITSGSGPAIWELPAALDIDLLYEKDSFKVGGGEINRIAFIDPRVSTEPDNSMPSGEMDDGNFWFYADIVITIGMTSKIFIMRDTEIAPSFLIELDGDMDTTARRAALVALGFREL